MGIYIIVSFWNSLQPIGTKLSPIEHRRQSQRNPASAHDHGVFNYIRFGLLQDKIKQHSTSKRIAGCFATNSIG